MKYVLYRKYYWVIIPKKSPWSVFQLFCYLFSHAGIKKGYRRVTWLGVLSYSKLKLEKEPPTNICPCCKVKLVPIRYEEYGCPIAPAQYFAGFIDPGGWYEEKIGEESTDRYEYAPVKHADSILKGLATAN
ncbi:MAG: hypothetical protein EB149_04510 [Thaumarchaeota archaeon]|nr:hypothetical protein [Nitrososphaerota archaeon]